MMKEPQSIEPRSVFREVENQRLREKCVNQRRELKRLNKLIHSLVGAQSWWRERYGMDVVPAAQKAHAHHEFRKMHQRAMVAERELARAKEHAAYWEKRARELGAEDY